MKRIDKILIVLLPLLVFLTGCRTYDDPDPRKLWSAEEITTAGYTIVPIATLKQLYYDEYGTGTIGQGVEITQKWAIEGKVISDDKSGNVYRTIYIQDETAGIEIKVGTYSNYTRYAPGQTVYVIAHNLVLGNYRYNLSLGTPSPTADYANGYINAKYALDHFLRPGARTQLTAADTTVITSPDQITDALVGRLVRIEGAVSRWGVWSSDNYPSFLESIQTVYGDMEYNNYSFLTVIDEWTEYYQAKAIAEKNGEELPTPPASPEPARLYPTYAYSFNNNKYYGSARFEFGSPSDDDPAHNLIVRTSGYADFALQPVPASGTVVDITAILNKYSSRTGGFIRYQLMLNKYSDVRER